MDGDHDLVPVAKGVFDDGVRAHVVMVEDVFHWGVFHLGYSIMTKGLFHYDFEFVSKA